jgi:predicted ATPase/class 3 adenylate cyclase
MPLNRSEPLAEQLSKRELEILTLLTENKTNQEIADQLHLALSSVKWFASEIYGKLGVENRRQAVRKAAELGLLEEASQPHEPAPFPSGIVTFLFTDVAGAGLLWEKLPAAMGAASAQHQAILRQAITANGGQVIQAAGDSFQAAFRLALDGLRAAHAAQQALQAASWGPTGPLKVRMGLHTGHAELDGRENPPYQAGPTLHRAGHIAAAGYGGQILLSQETADLVQYELPAGYSLLNLGHQRLGSAHRPERLYQLVAPGLTDHFPPLATGVRYPHNLPTPLTSFIGREKEISALEDLFLSQSARLVTLTGPGGTGKTRLALKAAETLLQLFPQGVWLVELAPVCESLLVTRAVAEVLGVPEETNLDLVQVLAGYLRQRRMLLILDNCEHVVAEAASLATRLLQACPQLHILATSRELLGVAGEVPFACPALSLPANTLKWTSPEGLSGLAETEAVSLFIERAQTVAPGLALTESNAPLVLEICQRLDGIPLAIELAAARTRLLSLEQIAARLDQAFRLLTGGSRSALPHHQTLKALIDWSYALLTEEERALLVRLSVFAGGWTLEAAEAVCTELLNADPAVAPAEGQRFVAPAEGQRFVAPAEGQRFVAPAEGQILELMGQLLDKSLIQIEQSPLAGAGRQGETRYRMLETVRQYAQEQMQASRQPLEALRERHLDYFLALAQRAQQKIRTQEIRRWLDTLERELDNLRLALEWSLARSLEKGLSLAAAMHWFWYMRDHYTEAMEWLERLLAADAVEQSDGLPRSPSRQAARGRALYTCNLLAVEAILGDTSQARERGLESQAIFQKLSAGSSNSPFQRDLAIATFSMADTLQDFLDCRKAFLALDDAFYVAECDLKLSDLYFDLSDFAQTAFYNEEDLALRKKIGDIDGEGFAWFVSSFLSGKRGEFALAVEQVRRSLATMEQIGNRAAREFPSSTLRLFLMAQSDYPGVLERVEIDRAMGEELNSPILQLDALSYEAFACWALHEHERAVLCAQRALHAAVDLPFPWKKLALYVLGRAALTQGDYPQAGQLFTQILPEATAISGFHDFRPIQALGVLAARQGQYRRAALLFGAQAIQAGWTLKLMCSAEREEYEQALAAARAGLGEEQFEAAWKEGGAMPAGELWPYARELP